MKRTLDAICEFYGTTPEIIFRKTRKVSSLKYRQIFVYLVKEIDYELKYAEISMFIFGYSNCFYGHATHKNSIKAISDMIDAYPKFRSEIKELKMTIREDLPAIVVKEVNLLNMCAKTF